MQKFFLAAIISINFLAFGCGNDGTESCKFKESMMDTLKTECTAKNTGYCTGATGCEDGYDSCKFDADKAKKHADCEQKNKETCGAKTGAHQLCVFE